MLQLWKFMMFPGKKLYTENEDREAGSNKRVSKKTCRRLT